MTMEWAKNVFCYTPLERSLLSKEAESPFVNRYKRIVHVRGVDVGVVVAPSVNSEKIPPLPPIVLIHGLGGNLECFLYLALALHPMSDIVMIDLPGHGISPDPPSGADAFSPFVIVEILNQVIEATCNPDLPFILMGHSYGTTHSLRISTGRLRDRCIGLILITPPYGKTIPDRERNVCKYMPVLIFDSVFRARDRRKGLYGPSVNRMVSRQTGDGPRRDQIRCNLMARTNTVLQTVAESNFFDISQEPDFPKCPMLIICAAEDKVCPPWKAERMFKAFRRAGKANVRLVEVGNAGHGIMYERPDVLNGVISSFLHDEIDDRLSMSWQLSYLASLDNKWSLKNEEKWNNTPPVGSAVGKNPKFKGMKVLREGDKQHGPAVFEASHPEIAVVIDISQQDPPYDPSSFKRIKYFKFPTISKTPPSKAEVRGFIDLVDSIKPNLKESDVIAVHCHYGFNRTGFFISSYLIEREGFSVNEALSAYAQARAPGIKHQHFTNELRLRYDLNIRYNL